MQRILFPHLRFRPVGIENAHEYIRLRIRSGNQEAIGSIPKRVHQDASPPISAHLKEAPYNDKITLSCILTNSTCFPFIS